MKTGAIDIDEAIDDSEKPRRPGAVGSPGTRSGGPGDNGNDDNNGENKPGGGPKPGKSRNPFPEPEIVHSKSRILMWFLLMVVIMTFGGLIGAYVVIASNSALEWRPFSLPYQVWISTVILLASGITYHLSLRSLVGEKFDRSRKLLLATTVLGAVFISSQILSWMALVGRGLYMAGNSYAGFFYILTAVHAVHVLGGMCALGYLTLKTWYAPASDIDQQKNIADATAIGWYWHTMDALWLILLSLLGFFR